MYEKYIQTYKHHAHTYGPSTAVFMLVGSFYELYDIPDAMGEGQTSMKRAVDILGIQLKVKKGDAPGGQNGLFAGFPESQLHKFAALLTRENWTVVVVDQMKDSTGKVTERSVARILSPGTHVEASQSGDSFYLGGLWLEGDSWATASTLTTGTPSFAAVAIDLTTGSVTSYEGTATGRRDAWSSDELLHFFQVHPVKELTVWWRGHALDSPTEGTLRRILGVPTSLLHIRQATTLGPVAQKEIVREDLLRRCFKPKSLLPLRQVLGLAGRVATEIALCATLLFVEDHFPSAMDNLHTPRPWNPREAMILGNHALTQLNMITGREEDSVLGLFTRTYTTMGRRAMRKRLLFPVCLEEEITCRLEEVGWCHGLASADTEAMAATLRQIQDLSRLHRRVTMGQVNAADVLALDQSYGCTLRLAEQMSDGPLAATADLMASFAELRTAFASVFSVEKALAASEELFCLTEEAGPATAAVEEATAAKKEELETTYTKIVDWLQETKETLRLDFKEVSVQLTGGKVMMGRVASRLKAAMPPPPDYLSGTVTNAKKSSSSIEVPSLQKLFFTRLRLREDLGRSIKAELPGVCDHLSSEYREIWDRLEEWVSRVDVSLTLARVATERGFCRPVLRGRCDGGEGGSMEVEGLRHPLIEGQQTRTEYVRHDVSLGTGAACGWLVYGMNASGKSSLMKAVGISVLLAQCGSFVPAEKFTFQPFRALYTRILNTDNLWAGLSSFAVEMTELREVLVRADEAALVLGDEVCSGTESESATALVAATLERFQVRGVRYIFATHLHGLQALPTVAGLSNLKVWHLRVRHDPATGRLVYERTLQPGAGSSLYGLEVAKAMGLPEDVLESARRIRKAIAGTATEDAAPTSSWNAAIQRRACEVCGAAIVRQLEVHHIRERATASSSGYIADGTHMNSMRNLSVLCEGCHDKHHAGEIEVGPIQQTSEGPIRSIVELRKFAHVPSSAARGVAAAGGLTEEQRTTVEGYLRKYPAAPAKRILYDLKEKEGITITEPRLRAVRASLV